MKPSHINSLVVGVDFSEYSKVVAKEAKQLARRLQVPATFVYVFESVGLTDTFVLDRRKIAKICQDKAREMYDIDNEKIVVRFGKPDKKIIAVASKQKSPLIIIGHKGGFSLTRYFVGSIAEKIATTSPFPVWIHRGEKVTLPHKILIPSDLDKKMERTIHAVEPIQNRFQSDIEVYHVLPEPSPLFNYPLWSALKSARREADERLVDKFKEKHPDLKFIRSRGAVAESIQEHSSKFDLVAISGKKTNKQDHSLGRVAGKLLRSGTKPILVVP